MPRANKEIKNHATQIAGSTTDQQNNQEATQIETKVTRAPPARLPFD